MKSLLLAISLSVSCATGANACPGTRLPTLVAASSYGAQSDEFDAQGIQSSEGAVWQVFRGTRSGNPVNIVLTVYGEMGKQEDRLVIAGANAYAIVRTVYRYSAPVTDPKMQIQKASRTVFTFCDGVVQKPDRMSAGAFTAHKKAATASKAPFRASEVQRFMRDLSF